MPSHPLPMDTDTWVSPAAVDPFDTQFLAPPQVPVLEPLQPALGEWLHERAQRCVGRVMEALERSLEHAAFHRSARPLIAIGALGLLRTAFLPLLLWTFAVAWVASTLAAPADEPVTRVELPVFVIEAGPDSAPGPVLRE